MANVTITFNSSALDNSEMRVIKTPNNQILLEIASEGYSPSFITLDKSTAIKFAKTLRTEINKI